MTVQELRKLAKSKAFKKAFRLRAIARGAVIVEEGEDPKHPESQEYGTLEWARWSVAAFLDVLEAYEKKGKIP